MRRGAALGAVDKRGNTAAMLARKQGHVDVAKMLEGGTPPPLEPGASPLADRREADPPRRSPLAPEPGRGAASPKRVTRGKFDSSGKRMREGEEAPAECKRAAVTADATIDSTSAEGNADAVATAAAAAADVNEVTIELHVRGGRTHKYVAADGEAATLHEVSSRRICCEDSRSDRMAHHRRPIARRCLVTCANGTCSVP